MVLLYEYDKANGREPARANELREQEIIVNLQNYIQNVCLN
jgi:hypothetical protein